MAKRKPKPEPVVDPAEAEADAHARAATVTDPAAFDFAFGAAAEAAPAPRDATADGGSATDRHGHAPDPSAEAVPPAATAEEPARRRARDPFPVASITLGTDKESPRVRLFRSDRFKQVAIRFDEKPDETYRDLLRDAGFQWRADDGVWTKQFDPERRWRTVAEAEALFERIGNGLRADRGLPPVRVLGG